METGINMSTAHEKEDIESFAAAINSIFDSAFKNHMDNKTTQQAIKAIGGAFSITNSTIANNSLNG